MRHNNYGEEMDAEREKDKKEVIKKHSNAIAKATLEYAIRVLENFPIEEALEFLREELKKKS